MIRVTVELVPFGIESRKRPPGTIVIANDATGSMTTGNYKFRMTTRDGSKYKEGRVEGFPRQRLLAYDLLFRCLKTAVGHRNP
jgi:hypothetical protein